MKTPPFLLLAVLLFWGWQGEFLVVGAVLGLVLEGARYTKTRWDLSDEDFSRIWTFCTLLFLAAAVYAFTDSGGPETFRGLFQTASISAQRSAGVASAKTAAAIIRWLPMLFFLFIAAQAYSTREEIPFYTVSLILQRRWRKAKKMGRTLPPGRGVNMGYPYFTLCLFASCVHSADDTTFFYGTSALLTWALWPFRSRRYGTVFWSCALALGILLGFFGQLSIGPLQRYASNLNAQWIAELLRSGRGTDPTQSKTEIGQIGRVKTSMKIVIWLAPKRGAPPDYLREASYRAFRTAEKAAVWFAGPSKLDFENVPPEKDGTTWILVPNKTNNATIGISCYVHGGTGLLPLPENTGQLDKLPAYVMRKNSAGAVLAEGPGLVMFDAEYGPGTLIDAPPTDVDTSVPMKEIPALDEVLGQLQLKGKGTNEALLVLNSYFQNKFTYRMWQDAPGASRTNETPVGRFLLHTHAGHCEYFATATVLLLRHLGIPARYAVGYMVHEASGNGYVVRERDAHAWCIVWDQKTETWRDFDTTPASWVEEEEHSSPLQGLFDAWSWVQFQVSKLRWGQGHLREWILAFLIPVLVLLLYQIIRRRRRHRPDATRSELAIIWPGLDSEFYQIQKQLAGRGFERRRNETLSGWLQRAVADPALDEFRDLLLALLRLHYRYRFDPEGLSEADREELRRQAAGCLARVSASTVRPSRQQEPADIEAGESPGPRLSRKMALRIAAVVLLAGIVVTAMVWRMDTRAKTSHATCITFLRQIDVAKRQWAADHNKSPDDVPRWNDLVGSERYLLLVPKCPQGGVYTLGRIGDSPHCSIPMHSLNFGYVHVIDEQGQPVVGATVLAQGAKFTGDRAKTDDKGHALVTHFASTAVEEWSQGDTVIVASMTGYETARAQLPAGWPVVITLKKTAK